MKLIDLTGKRFGRLTVLRQAPTIRGRAMWVCGCECEAGREVTLQASGLSAGRTNSCGCLRVELAGSGRRTHGRSGTREFHSWSHAKRRCYSPRSPKWASYGGRGITMCQRWRESFAAFFEDMGPRAAGLSIDRIDNNGHYSCGRHDLCSDCRDRNLPANCRWATSVEQGRNTRTNVTVDVGGEIATVAEWGDRTGLPRASLYARSHRGVTGDAFASPESLEQPRVIEGPDGTRLRLAEWARRTGVSAATILWRIDNGWSEALAATTPKTHRFRPARQKQ